MSKFTVDTQKQIERITRSIGDNVIQLGRVVGEVNSKGGDIDIQQLLTDVVVGFENSTACVPITIDVKAAQLFGLRLQLALATRTGRKRWFGKSRRKRIEAIYPLREREGRSSVEYDIAAGIIDSEFQDYKKALAEQRDRSIVLEILGTFDYTEDNDDWDPCDEADEV